MRYLILPDLEAVINKALRDEGIRAYSSVPNDPVWPLCVVHRAGGAPVVREYLDAARIQIDVWGGAKGDAVPVPKSEIADLVQQARIVVLELEGTTVHEPVEAFISGVDDGTINWLPDDATGRDRYFFEVTVYGRSLLPGESLASS